MLTRAIVCGAMAIARLVELGYSRRNLAKRASAEEGAWSRRTFPLMVSLHVAVIGGTFLRGGRPQRGWLLALGLLQPVRLWVLLTLGRRWSARGAVASEVEIATNGPYRYIRHPNYAVVLGELALLPLSFGLKRAALLAFILNTAVLVIRIRDEERLLFRLPGYRQHFERKRRLLPGLI